jgi:hypothetical protein
MSIYKPVRLEIDDRLRTIRIARYAVYRSGRLSQCATIL